MELILECFHITEGEGLSINVLIIYFRLAFGIRPIGKPRSANRWLRNCSFAASAEDSILGYYLKLTHILFSPNGFQNPENW